MTDAERRIVAVSCAAVRGSYTLAPFTTAGEKRNAVGKDVAVILKPDVKICAATPNKRAVYLLTFGQQVSIRCGLIAKMLLIRTFDFHVSPVTIHYRQE
jgi:hypothetical protein